MKRNVFFITGTDTEVGKTVVTALLGMLFQSLECSVGVMKPVSSGGRGDALFLKEMLSIDDDIDVITPVNFDLALSPNIAAHLTGKSVDFRCLFDTFNDMKKKYDVLLVEGIGGLLVPLTDSYFVKDLIIDLEASCIIVTRRLLGTLNHTFLTVESLKTSSILLEGIIFNDTHHINDSVIPDTNSRFIAQSTQLRILGTIPFLKEMNKKSLQSRIHEYFSKEWIEELCER
ncbi:dethiobiotin synthase [Chlamydiota bacterium]